MSALLPLAFVLQVLFGLTLTVAAGYVVVSPSSPCRPIAAWWRRVLIAAPDSLRLVT
jgi:hypothetical protein